MRCLEWRQHPLPFTLHHTWYLVIEQWAFMFVPLDLLYAYDLVTFLLWPTNIVHNVLSMILSNSIKNIEQKSRACSCVELYTCHCHDALEKNLNSASQPITCAVGRHFEGYSIAMLKRYLLMLSCQLQVDFLPSSNKLKMADSFLKITGSWKEEGSVSSWFIHPMRWNQTILNY